MLAGQNVQRFLEALFAHVTPGADDVGKNIDQDLHGFYNELAAGRFPAEGGRKVNFPY
jgi:hypothetical protein